MIFSLATKVLLTMVVFAHSLATTSSTTNDKKKTSALTLLFDKTDLNFSISSLSSPAEKKGQSWTCNDEEFLHFLFPSPSGRDPCDCVGSGRSDGFHLPRTSTRSMMSQRKAHSFRRHLEQKSTKSPSSSGKKKSVLTPAPTPAPATPAPTPAPEEQQQVCFSCCGACTTTATTCYGTTLFSSTAKNGGLYCRWSGASEEPCEMKASFEYSNSACYGTIPLTANQCIKDFCSNRKLARHEEDEHKKSIAMKKHNTVMAFLRIPKTGSTTMSHFLATISYLFDWYEHLSSNKNIKAATDGKDHPEDPSVVVVRNNDDAKYEATNNKATTNTNSGGQQENNNKKAAGNGAISCMFAHVPTTAHLGSNFHDAADKKTNHNAENNNRRWWNACPHIPYPGLLRQWTKSLDKWSVPETAVVEQDDDKNGAMTTPFSFGFQAFSMVRDPFDRLVSYFSYLGKFTNTTEFLKQTVTEEQYEKIKAGDLQGWMKLLHEQGGGCGLKLPYQYHYFHEDLDTAIDLIEVGKDGEAPKVFTLVTECYEASLYLLTEVVEGLEPDYVKDFVNSPGYMSNKNKNSITNQDSYGEGKEEDSLGGLRVLARDWFQEDYVFYDAAVAQFKEYLAKSNVDRVHFKSCVHWDDVALDDEEMGEVVAAF